MGAAQNEMEQKYLENYQSEIRALNKDEAKLKEIKARMREMMFSKGERGAEWNKEMTALNNRSKILSDKINRGDKKLLNLEATKPLKAVLERERAKVETKNAEARREAVQQVRQQKEESIGKAKYRARLSEDMKTLRTWLTSPTNKAHVPEFLRAPLGNFLNSFNYASVRKLDGGDQTQNDQKITEAMDKLRSVLANAQKTSQGMDTTGAEYFSGYLDLPADFIDTFDALRQKIQRTLENSKGISDIPINRMTAAQLKDLSQSIRLINAAVRNMNRLINNASFESARGAARNTINLMDQMGEKKDQSKIGNAISSMIDWRNVTPYYVFQRFGEGGKSIFTELMDGWDKMAYKKALNDRMREIVYKTQVVDSTLTRSSLMRDKGLTSIFTAFMSEPTLTMSMLQESIFEARMKARQTGERFHLTAKTAKAFATWGVTAGLAAIFEAAFTAWRDDDDYEKWIDKFLAALGFKGNVMDGSLYDNANLLHNIPYVSDVTEILEKMLRGETVGNATMGISPLEGLTATANGITNLLKVLRGENASYTTYGIIYKLLTGMSQVSGIAASGAARDGIAVFNTIAEQMGWRKIQTYPDSKNAAATSYYTAIKAGSEDDAKWVLERAKLYGVTDEDIQKKIPGMVKEAYIAGEIDAKTAQEHLTAYAAKDTDDTYWTVKEWDAKATDAESFSKYGDLRKAVANGSIADARAAMSELTAHGTKENDVLSDVTKLYNSGEATNLTALELRAPKLYTTTSNKVDADDFDPMITAIVSGRNIAGEVQKARSKYNHKQIMSAINGAFGKKYDTYATMIQYNPSQAKTLLSRILDAYEALGMSREKEEEWIKENWLQ